MVQQQRPDRRRPAGEQAAQNTRYVRPGGRLNMLGAPIEFDRTRGQTSEERPARPSLFIPTAATDSGARPVGLNSLLGFPGIQLLSGTTPVAHASAGGQFTVRCQVANGGTASSYAGMAIFYIAAGSAFSDAECGVGPAPPIHSMASFVLAPSQTASIVSPVPWIPQTAQDALLSIVVHAFDFLLDPLGKGFDWRNNPHVGRLDFLPDFSGSWEV